MDEMNYDKMGREALRVECRNREIKYGKLDTAGMRAALRADDAAHKEFGASEFEMSEEELAAQTGRQATADVEELQSDPITDASTGVTDIAPAPLASGTRKGVSIEKDRDERNGVKRPSKGGVCRQVWDMLDAIGKKATAKEARAKGAELGLNKTTTMVQFYQWRKFNGITGRASK